MIFWGGGGGFFGGCVFFCVLRLREFFCGGSKIFWWRGFGFIWRLHVFCVLRLREFLCEDGARFFVWRGCVMFLCGEVALFFSLTHSLIHKVA